MPVVFAVETTEHVLAAMALVVVSTTDVVSAMVTTALVVAVMEKVECSIFAEFVLEMTLLALASSIMDTKLKKWTTSCSSGL
jgi:hypothetical protein